MVKRVVTSNVGWGKEALHVIRGVFELQFTRVQLSQLADASESAPIGLHWDRLRRQAVRLQVR